MCVKGRRNTSTLSQESSGNERVSQLGLMLDFAIVFDCSARDEECEASNRSRRFNILDKSSHSITYPEIIPVLGHPALRPGGSMH